MNINQAVSSNCTVTASTTGEGDDERVLYYHLKGSNEMKTTHCVTTPVVLIVGEDEKGNEIAYAKSSFVPTGWIDLQNESDVTARYVANYVLPKVIKVRFGKYEMSLDDWKLCGCPYDLCAEEMMGLKRMTDAWQAEAEAQAADAKDLLDTQEDARR